MRSSVSMVSTDFLGAGGGEENIGIHAEMLFARWFRGRGVERRIQLMPGEVKMHAHEADADANEGFETFHCLGGSREYLHISRRENSNLDFVKKGSAKAPPPIGCSAEFSCQRIAAFQQTCFRFNAKAANCFGSFNGFYSFGG
jgi:hypothetical protein